MCYQIKFVRVVRQRVVRRGVAQNRVKLPGDMAKEPVRALYVLYHLAHGAADDLSSDYDIGSTKRWVTERI